MVLECSISQVLGLLFVTKVELINDDAEDSGSCAARDRFEAALLKKRRK